MSKSNSTKKLCPFPGCDQIQVCKGLCGGHYAQKRRTGRMWPLYTTQRRQGSPPRIICDEVPCPVPGLIGPCHVFRGAKNSDGYGSVSTGGPNTIGVHVYIWIKTNGPVSEGMEIDHQCRVRACCNEDHLREVPHKINVVENSVNFAAKNKAKTHCPQGHPYDEKNTIWYRHGRYCRACTDAKNAAARLKRIDSRTAAL